MTNLKNHWNNIFHSTENCKLGWFEQELNQTLKYFKLTGKEKTVFVSGVGTSEIVEELLKENYKLILNDISEIALKKVKKRIKNDSLTYICQNIATPMPNDIQCDIWFDRAVLHFLLKEEEIEQYFYNLKNSLNSNGYVLFGEFAHDGATKCAGLELHRYSVQELSQRLGEEFKLIKSENYIYLNPAGDTRKYIYALYKKVT